jgi:hypothetical protein
MLLCPYASNRVTRFRNNVSLTRLSPHLFIAYLLLKLCSYSAAALFVLFCDQHREQEESQMRLLPKFPSRLAKDTDGNFRFLNKKDEPRCGEVVLKYFKLMLLPENTRQLLVHKLDDGSAIRQEVEQSQRFSTQDMIQTFVAGLFQVAFVKFQRWISPDTMNTLVITYPAIIGKEARSFLKQVARRAADDSGTAFTIKSATESKACLDAALYNENGVLNKLHMVGPCSALDHLPGS